MKKTMFLPAVSPLKRNTLYSVLFTTEIIILGGFFIWQYISCDKAWKFQNTFFRLYTVNNKVKVKIVIKLNFKFNSIQYSII